MQINNEYFYVAPTMSVYKMVLSVALLTSLLLTSSCNILKYNRNMKNCSDVKEKYLLLSRGLNLNKENYVHKQVCTGNLLSLNDYNFSSRIRTILCIIIVTCYHYYILLRLE